jgi:septum formation protein
MPAKALPGKCVPAVAAGEIILASRSIARARLLTGAGIRFEMVPSGLDEAAVKGRHKEAGAGALARILAGLKAVEVSRLRPGAVVVGADQVLECAGTLYDKPSGRAAARSQLQTLRGRAHILVSALSVVCDGIAVWRYEETVTLTMRAFSDGFLESYLDMAGTAATRSVGGYELEGLGAQLFDRIEGDYFAVLGLPLLPLLDLLRGRGLIPQ